MEVEQLVLPPLCGTLLERTIGGGGGGGGGDGGGAVRRSSHRSVPVVHNYGHGGSGLTLAWGCAGDAVQLVIDALGDC
jgi:hypothetical protein